MTPPNATPAAADPATLGWPPPPLPVYRLRLVQRIAAWFLVLLCGSLIPALATLNFGLTEEGRGLLVDPGLAIGLGARLGPARTAELLDACRRRFVAGQG